MSSSNCCFLTCTHIYQEADQVVWYSHFLKNFSQFVVIHTVKGFGVVNNAEVYVQSHQFMANRWGNNWNSDRFYFLVLQSHCRWWLQPSNSKTLAPWKKKTMTHLDSILKCRDITLLTKVKPMGFPLVMYEYESWTIKKADHQRIDVFELWCWIRLLRVPWTARRSNQSILKEINLEYSLEGLTLKLKLQYFGHLMWRADSLEKTLMLGKIKNRRWRGWQRMRWLDVITDSMDMSFSNPGRWWRAGEQGMLKSMGSQRVGQVWATEQQQQQTNLCCSKK